MRCGGASFGPKREPALATRRAACAAAELGTTAAPRCSRIHQHDACVPVRRPFTTGSAKAVVGSRRRTRCVESDLVVGVLGGHPWVLIFARILLGSRWRDVEGWGLGSPAVRVVDDLDGLLRLGVCVTLAAQPSPGGVALGVSGVTVA